MTTSNERPTTTAEAEREVQDARAGLESSIEALQEKFDPDMLMERTAAYLKGDDATLGQAVLREARANPMAALMTGIGVAWLALGVSRRAQARTRIARQPAPPVTADPAPRTPDPALRTPDPALGTPDPVDRPATDPVVTPRDPIVTPSTRTAADDEPRGI